MKESFCIVFHGYILNARVEGLFFAGYRMPVELTFSLYFSYHLALFYEDK